MPIYSNDLLPTETVLTGPTIIEESTATIVVTEDLKARMDKFGNVMVTRK